MDRPNILLITCDQMRSDAMGCAGNEVAQTPHMDLLARKGARFSQAYSCQPVCIPARASILTGLEGHQLGITRYQEGYQLPTDRTIPRMLSEEGYQTQLIGKLHQYPERDHKGFDSVLLCEEGRPFGRAAGEHRGYDDYESWLAEQGYAGQAFSHGISNNEHYISPWHLPDHLHPTEWIGTETCKAIKRRDWTRPFFMWASFTAPHPPLTPLQKDLFMYDGCEMPDPAYGDWVEDEPLYHQRMAAAHRQRDMTEKQLDLAYRGYYALITQVDRQINRLIGTLREENVLDHTWILFTSDHGDNMGDHGLWHKSNFLKGSCQIPFIVMPPEQENKLDRDWLPGTVSDSPVGLQDLLPTILDIAGVSCPPDLDGRSLLPLLSNPKAQVRETILGEFGAEDRRSLMLTDGKWKYIWYEEDGKELLFHIEEDPDECFNLIRKQREIAVQWREKLVTILKQRENDPALSEHDLKSAGGSLTEKEKAHMTSNRGARGLH